MQGVQGEAAFETLARATELERQGKSIVHLEIGEPDFDTPGPVVRAGIESLKKGKTHYAPVNGVRELREAVARRLSERHGASVDPSCVLIRPGAKVMIFAGMKTTSTTDRTLMLIEEGETESFDADKLKGLIADLVAAGGRNAEIAALIATCRKKSRRSGYLLIKARKQV